MRLHFLATAFDFGGVLHPYSNIPPHKNQAAHRQDRPSVRSSPLNPVLMTPQQQKCFFQIGLPRFLTNDSLTRRNRK